jgi:predicted O-linked N-acetylglucosamine transferase (SPINDLY family)
MLRAVLEQAMQLQRAGQFAQALAKFEQYTRLAPGDVAGWHGLAATAQQARDFQRADAAAKRMLAVRPADPQLLLLAGNIREDLGDRPGALAYLETAVRLDPRFAQGHNNLGILQRSLGLREKAFASFRAALKAKPDYMRAWNNLGSMLIEDGQSEEARECYRKAIALDPKYPHAHVGLGLLQLAEGQFEEARASFTRAVELEPRLAEAHLGLGRLHREVMDLDAAELSLRQSISLNPRGVEALVALAEVVAEKGDRNTAVECYRQAAAAQPASLRARLGLALTLPQVYASRDEIDNLRRAYSDGLAALATDARPGAAAAAAVETVTDIQWNNFYLAYQGRDDRELQARFARYQRAVLEPALPQFYEPIAARTRSGRRLRVGFASHFFYRCTAGSYFKSWITKLDRERFETVVFSFHNKPDELTAEVRAAATRFREDRLSFARLAEAVRNEELDVLIYPELGMHPRTFTLASLRLAPLQCAGWGHPVTTGHANVDVFLSSEAMEPPGGEAHYTERLVKLPGIGTSYTRPAVPARVARAQLGLPEEAVLFLFPQSLFKVHPDNDDLLVDILAREPRAVIVMFQSRHQQITQQFIDRLSRRFSARGLATAGRMKLLPNVDHTDYLRLNLACDAMLDSLYWSGGNTSLDAIACSLPIVTRPGELMRGRQSAGMLSILGLGELVAPTNEDYVELALRLARDVPYRENLRATIAERSARLFDQEAPVRVLESFLLASFPD